MIVDDGALPHLSPISPPRSRPERLRALLLPHALHPLPAEPVDHLGRAGLSQRDLGPLRFSPVRGPRHEHRRDRVPYDARIEPVASRRAPTARIARARRPHAAVESALPFEPREARVEGAREEQHRRRVPHRQAAPEPAGARVGRTPRTARQHVEVDRIGRPVDAELPRQDGNRRILLLEQELHRGAERHARLLGPGRPRLVDARARMKAEAVGPDDDLLRRRVPEGRLLGSRVRGRGARQRERKARARGRAAPTPSRLQAGAHPST